MKRSRLQIFYSGNVQGVGFRYTTKGVAAGYEVTGLVRNLPDGRVELVAEGTRNELEAFRQGIRDSGLGSGIEDEKMIFGKSRQMNFAGLKSCPVDFIEGCAPQ